MWSRPLALTAQCASINVALLDVWAGLVLPGQSEVNGGGPEVWKNVWHRLRATFLSQTSFRLKRSTKLSLSFEKGFVRDKTILVQADQVI
jgi:hypothetical protein